MCPLEFNAPNVSPISQVQVWKGRCLFRVPVIGDDLLRSLVFQRIRVGASADFPRTLWGLGTENFVMLRHADGETDAGKLHRIPRAEHDCVDGAKPISAAPIHTAAMKSTISKSQLSMTAMSGLATWCA